VKLHPDLDFVISSHSTVGDKNQTTPLHLLSPYSSTQPAKSLWTEELEKKLNHGDLDLIVHSCKDIPTVLLDDFEIACLLKREDPRDGVAIKAGTGYTKLSELPEGSVVGTGSVRRVAQLKRAYPGLVFQDMRGNL
jgi:hydroxymethylbilane synthase